MIGKSRSTSVMRAYESQRRHEIRNLRCKISTLLPQSSCPRHQKRKNDPQGKINNNKIKPKTASDWNKSIHLEKSNEFPHKHKRIPSNLFAKLKPHEIQRINEDKLYYLRSEEQVQKFDRYISKNFPEQHQGLAKLGLKINFQSVRQQPKTTLSLKLISTRKLPPTKYLKPQKRTSFSAIHKQKSLKKRQFVKEELENQVAYQKILIKNKMQRAQFVHRDQKYQLFYQIKDRKRKYESQKQLVLHWRQKRQKKGQISG